MLSHTSAILPYTGLGLRLVREARETDKGGIVEVLEIVHVETGRLAGNFEENLRTVKGEFAPERVRTIKEISLDAIELDSTLGRFLVGYSRLGVSEAQYRPVYVASYVAKKQVDRLKDELKKSGIEFLILEEVLRSIVRDVDEWKRRQVEKGLRLPRE